ncbi:MAG: hypothetical protein Q7U54_12085 [Bacteroidales bacterium]|nr:hypothetical protein [Bacteroidales bacterium]
MKTRRIISLITALTFTSAAIAQTQGKTDKVDNTFQKGHQAIAKTQSIIQVFQPYLIKAQELYHQEKQLVSDVKNSAKKGNPNNSAMPQSAGNNPPQPDVANTGSQQGATSGPPSNYPSVSPPGGMQSTDGNNTQNSYNPQAGSGNQSYTGSGNQDVYVEQPMSLPVNNPATVNNDGTGNWGNQNNGLYGNCLDVLTGTVMGMGEAEEMPGSIDVVFVAANGAYTLMTPNFARNNSTATYMSNHSTDGISKWSTVNETEIAETRLSTSQFDQIQTNPQISNVVKNAVNYAGYVQYAGNKLDGKVFAVKAELENRTVYGLIAVVKHIGTDGGNGFLKIKIKAMGIDTNGDGQPDPGMYIRY